MGRRHSIAARKAAGDANKSKTYSIMSKQIQIAARNGSDPKMNPSLELALSKARYSGVPRDIVDRAILKGSGKLEGENLEEVFYEGFGPGGVAVVIKALTSNTNRTSSNLKLTLNKHGGGLGQQGSVSRQFKEKGVIVTDGKIKIDMVKGNEVENIVPLDEGKFEEDVMTFDVEDFEIQGNQAIVYTMKQNFTEVRSGLEGLGYHLNDADLQFIPDNTIDVPEIDRNRLQELLEALGNDEDVDIVWNNASE